MKEKEYKCPYCGQVYTGRYQIGGHISGHKKRGDILPVKSDTKSISKEGLRKFLEENMTRPISVKCDVKDLIDLLTDRFAQNANFMVIRIPDAEIEVGIVEHLGDEE